MPLTFDATGSTGCVTLCRSVCVCVLLFTTWAHSITASNLHDHTTTHARTAAARVNFARPAALQHPGHACHINTTPSPCADGAAKSDHTTTVLHANIPAAAETANFSIMMCISTSPTDVGPHSRCKCKYTRHHNKSHAILLLISCDAATAVLCIIRFIPAHRSRARARAGGHFDRINKTSVRFCVRSFGRCLVVSVMRRIKRTHGPHAAPRAGSLVNMCCTSTHFAAHIARTPCTGSALSTLSNRI